MDRLIYVENDYDGRYGRFWGELGDVVRDREVFLARAQDFDLVCFTGGEDVSPGLYNHKNLGSHNSAQRDATEEEIFEIAAGLKIPMTGICRGSQFLNVMMGGTMVQNLKASHGGSPHMMKVGFDDTPLMEVTSSHHQMSVLKPGPDGGTYLGWSEETVPLNSLTYDGHLQSYSVVGKHGMDNATEIHATEAFIYRNANIFAVQHHPEWQDINCEAAQWTLNMIKEYCFEETSTSIKG